jgi:hypothetical protein
VRHDSGVALLVVVSALVVSPSLALGCSGDVLPPEEVVAWAEAVVRVKVVGQSPPATQGRLGLVAFAVLEVLKGNAASETLRFAGQTDVYFGRNREAVPYKFPRPGGGRGGCYATDYLMGKEYLLILRRPHPHWPAITTEDVDMTPYWTILAPTTEEVSGADDPWVSWVRDRLSKDGSRPLLAASRAVEQGVGADERRPGRTGGAARSSTPVLCEL